MSLPQVGQRLNVGAPQRSQWLEPDSGWLTSTSVMTCPPRQTCITSRTVSVDMGGPGKALSGNTPGIRCAHPGAWGYTHPLGGAAGPFAPLRTAVTCSASAFSIDVIA